jgi:endonuclease/exonuclease/phosphatase (EEP) superfamily protein YafD
MTFNLHGDYTPPGAIATAIRQANPDIAVLQEVSSWQANQLGKELGATLPYASKSAAYWTSGLGIFSRYPIQSVEWVTLGRSWRQALHVVIAIEGRQLHIVDVHLTSSSGAYGGWRYLPQHVRSTYAQRETEASQLHEVITQLDGPVILAGDFNTTEQTTAYRVLAQGLQDAFRAAGWGLGNTYPAESWRFGRLPVPARLVRIDHITYSSQLTALEAYVAHGSTSDHLPVMARMAFR